MKKLRRKNFEIGHILFVDFADNYAAITET